MSHKQFLDQEWKELQAAYKAAVKKGSEQAKKEAATALFRFYQENEDFSSLPKVLQWAASRLSWNPAEYSARFEINASGKYAQRVKAQVYRDLKAQRCKSHCGRNGYINVSYPLAYGHFNVITFREGNRVVMLFAYHPNF